MLDCQICFSQRGDRWGFHNADYCTMVTFRYLVHLVFSKIAGEANFKSCLHIQTKDMKDHVLCHQRSDNIKKRECNQHPDKI